MKRTFVLIMLSVISINERVIAQSAIVEETKKIANWSTTEKKFNAPYIPSVRDFVYLKNGKMILEMQQIADYSDFKNIVSILSDLQKNMAFYKDSLTNSTDNVRIDYSIEHGKEYTQMRIKKYHSDGEIFVNRHGETERLKIEQDTVRILIGARGKRFPLLYPVQATFILNNYADFAKIIAEKNVIEHAIDTLATVRTEREMNRPYKYPTSCIYHPYVIVTEESGSPKYRYTIGSKDTVIPAYRTPLMHFVKFNQLLQKEYGQFKVYDLPNRKFAAYGNFGVGLIRNTLAPSVEAGITYINYYAPRFFGERKDYEFTSLYITSLFFFNTNANGEHIVNDNYFINLESGSTFDQDMLGVKVRGVSAGAGYLVSQKGDYFKGSTMKLFMGLRLRSGLTVYPELIATNSFKQIFPGITVKIFGFKREQKSVN